MRFEEFRSSDRPSLGVELELQLVDSESMALRGAAEKVLARIPEGIRDSVKPEFYRCCVEVNTGICRDVEEVGRDLSPKLRAAEQAAASHGLRLAWGGTHPFSHWREQPIGPTPRYQELAEQFRETLCRQLTFGLHVGVADGDGGGAGLQRDPRAPTGAAGAVGQQPVLVRAGHRPARPPRRGDGRLPDRPSRWTTAPAGPRSSPRGWSASARVGSSRSPSTSTRRGTDDHTGRAPDGGRPAGRSHRPRSGCPTAWARG